MKKILLLGGSAQQVVAIHEAKKLGYYTILCDFLTDNPGQYVADKFYLESTTDKERILEIAQKEQIDGVLAYASDPAAPTAAYVAEELNLLGNPYKSTEILCNKDQFRTFLLEHDFHTPKAKGYSSIEGAKADLEGDMYQLPVIVKPVDSSGSKGASVLYDIAQVESYLEFGFAYSRSHRIIVEEFIVKNHKYLIGGDVFVIDGKIALWGLLNCHRDSKVNTLVPIGKSYPLQIDKEQEKRVKETLQSLVTKLGFRNGGMNVELMIDCNGNVFPIDVGPRSGGNMIPDLLGYIFNINLVKMLVQVAMGELEIQKEITSQGFWATHNLHSDKNGIFKEINFSEEIEKFIVQKNIYKTSGDQIEYFDNAAKALGIVFLKFNTEETLLNMTEHINEHIEIKLV